MVDSNIDHETEERLRRIEEHVGLDREDADETEAGAQSEDG